MFGSFAEPDLAERLRGLAVWPVAAFVLCQVYLALYGVLPAVPRWLFEAVRLVLATGVVAGVGGAAWLVLRRGAGRARWTWAAAGWLALDLVASAACAWILLGMSVPFAV